MQNKFIETILNHKSIRKWKDEKLSDEIIDTLLNVASRTSSYMGMQMASIIRVVDKEQREKIAEICKQDYVKEAPEFWIYLADNFRNHKILEESGETQDYTNDADRFISSYIEASILAQNVANAAESLDLGIVYFGSVTNDPKEIVKILDLPKYVMPVVGMGIGYPDQSPQLKPRMDIQNRVFIDKYEVKENYHELLKSYDEEMVKYYDLRNTSKPLDKFTQQVVDKHKVSNGKRNEIIDVAREQGFDI